ncbi:pancreatic triacylglycerol lipase-like [Anthonomus grandis grandis]|uniref:pancreatic triacylglycerol lipase-like n=1 Tax=Anthonomus grandis grandis TaxID=2921223 RepID=UPI002164FA95|nr:pancreatic triacylglycerol lipase-like [Anthonomus grandis grandis]
MVAVPNNSSLIFQTLFYVMNQSIIQDESSYNYYYMRIGKETNSQKCYGMYGCFQLSPPWTSEHRPVSLFPNELIDIEPNYLVYTRRIRDNPSLINVNDFDYVTTSDIEPLKPIYIITHGYMEGGGIFWIKDISQALLDQEDCNVIVIDWHLGSSPPYTQAVANIRLIGTMTAHLLNDVAQYTENLGVEHVHCIGHSLGAHLCGYIGYTLQDVFGLNLGRISGLDPAEPHFAHAARPVRLDRTAAKYVDIIHSDASQFIRGSLGMTESIGHIDFFPNGGSNQPGCGKSMVQFIKDEKGSVFNGVKKYLGCNHQRAHQLYLDSIRPTCSYLTISCTSYEDFVDGKCWECGKYGERCIKFGYHSRKHYNKFYGDGMNFSLNQYLITSSERPFCRGHYRIIVKVSDTNESTKHGGEIGELIFKMHNTIDGQGAKTSEISFISGYYQPGGIYMKVVSAEEVKLRAVEVRWRHNSSLFNPLTWRFLTTPKIYLTKITVESLENQQRITICPTDKQPLINEKPQLLTPGNC